MHLPTLSLLHLMKTDFHLSDLTLCVGLKSLVICDRNFIKLGENFEIYQEQPSRLESFEVLAVPDSGRVLLQLYTARRTDGKPIVDATGLKKLCFDVSFDKPDDLKELFGHLTQLTSLEMYGTYNSIQQCTALFLYEPNHSVSPPTALGKLGGPVSPLSPNLAAFSPTDIYLL